MAPEQASRRGDGTHMKLLCSHGGHFQPCGPEGEPRYVGGETRVLVVPRAVSFRDLASRLAEMAGGAEVRAIRHRLADECVQDVIVSVTCDEELAHMGDEYDRLRATRPAARFRVFVTTPTASSSAGSKRATAAGLPPLAPPPSMRRVQSEQAFAARAQHQHRPARRVHSAQELAGGGVHMQPSFHHHHHHRHQHCCCCCCCQRRDRYTPAPPPARPTTFALHYMSRKVASPPSVSAAVAAAGRVAAVSTQAAAARRKATSRDVETAVENRRAIWELE